MTAILYSERLCAYAIRARMALRYAGVTHELREVDPANLPDDLLQISARGTVPVLYIAPGEILEESLEIMHWALLESDPDGWIDFDVDILDEINDLIHIHDHLFGVDLKTYQASPAGKGTRQEAREQCCLFIDGLEQRLQQQNFLFANRVSLADFALLPLVREFSQVEPEWFLNSTYDQLKKWLGYHEESRLFQQVMAPCPTWKPGTPGILLP